MARPPCNRLHSPHPSAQISRDADSALHALYAAQPKARELGQRAKAILIFPKIIKAGLIIGGQSGDGVLRVGGKTDGYYNISAASFGLQAGGQQFSYALFFMNDARPAIPAEERWLVDRVWPERRGRGQGCSRQHDQHDAEPRTSMPSRSGRRA